MSASKTFNFPAAGCAWAIIEDDRLRRAFAADIAAHVLHSPSVFGYDATLAAFRGGDAWLAAQLEDLRGNRDLVERALAAAGWPAWRCRRARSSRGRGASCALTSRRSASASPRRSPG